MKKQLAILAVAFIIISSFSFLLPIGAAPTIPSPITQTFAIGPSTDTYHSNRNYFIDANGSNIQTLTTTVTLTGPLSGTAANGGNFSLQVNAYSPLGFKAAYDQYGIGVSFSFKGQVTMYAFVALVTASDAFVLEANGLNSSTTVKDSFFVAGAKLVVVMNTDAAGNVVSISTHFYQADGRQVWGDNVPVTVFNLNGATGNAQTPFVGVEATLIGDGGADTTTFTKASGTISYSSTTALSWTGVQPNTFPWVQYKNLPGTVEKSNLSYQVPTGGITITSTSVSSIVNPTLQNITGTFTELAKPKPSAQGIGRDVGPATFGFSQTNGLSMTNPTGANLTIGIPTLTASLTTLVPSIAFQKNSTEYVFHLKKTQLISLTSVSDDAFVYVKNASVYNQREVIFAGTFSTSTTISVHLNSAQTPSVCDATPPKILYPNGSLLFAPPCRSVQFGNIVWDWSGCTANSPTYNNATRVWSITVSGAFVCDPIALDGSAKAGTNSGTSITCTLTTASSPDIIMADFSIFNEPSHAFVSISDSGGAGLTWIARVSALPATAGGVYLYEYYAVSSGTLTNDPIVLTIASASFMNINCNGISGANTAAGTIFDTNAGLPFTNTGTGGNASVVFSTSNANDYLQMMESDSNGPNANSAFSLTTDVIGKSATGIDLNVFGGAQTTAYTSYHSAWDKRSPGTNAWGIILDAVCQSGSTCSVTATQPITCTMSNSAPAATLSLSESAGSNLSPTTVSCDGASHNITVDVSITLTATEPADGSNQRDRFTGTVTTQTVTTCGSGTCTAWTFTNFDQLQNTYQASPTGGRSTFDAIYTIIPTGTFLGTAASNICTITTANGGGAASCTNWADYNQVVIFPTNPTGAGGTSWTAQTPTSFTDTTGGNTDNDNYKFVSPCCSLTNSQGLTITFISGGITQTSTASSITADSGTSVTVVGLYTCVYTIQNASFVYQFSASGVQIWTASASSSVNDFAVGVNHPLLVTFSETGHVIVCIPTNSKLNLQNVYTNGVVAPYTIDAPLLFFIGAATNEVDFISPPNGQGSNIPGGGLLTVITTPSAISAIVIPLALISIIAFAYVNERKKRPSGEYEPTQRSQTGKTWSRNGNKGASVSRATNSGDSVNRGKSSGTGVGRSESKGTGVSRAGSSGAGVSRAGNSGSSVDRAGNQGKGKGINRGTPDGKKRKREW